VAAAPLARSVGLGDRRTFIQGCVLAPASRTGRPETSPARQDHSVLLNGRQYRPSMVCGELANILLWQRPALIGCRLTPKVCLPNLANLLRPGKRTFDDNLTAPPGQRRPRTFPALLAFIRPDCRRTRPCGGLADMVASAANGSDRVPFAAHRKSANRAGRWRTGGLPQNPARDHGAVTVGVLRALSVSGPKLWDGFWEQPHRAVA
jgi:hypothetical protein